MQSGVGVKTRGTDTARSGAAAPLPTHQEDDEEPLGKDGVRGDADDGSRQHQGLQHDDRLVVDELPRRHQRVPALRVHNVVYNATAEDHGLGQRHGLHGGRRGKGVCKFAVARCSARARGSAQTRAHGNATQSTHLVRGKLDEKDEQGDKETAAADAAASGQHGAHEGEH